jgi:hypothetical protein
MSDVSSGWHRAEEWCRTTAGPRVHGTTAWRLAEHFVLEEAARLLPAPEQAHDLPIYATAKGHNDIHIEVARALYSIPGNLIGSHVEIRADRQLVRGYFRGALVKTHPRQGRTLDRCRRPAGAQGGLRHARLGLASTRRCGDVPGRLRYSRQALRHLMVAST